MNTKQKLTLGIAAIFMVTLTIVGVTYAYFVTRVVGETPESINVSTANVGSVEYQVGSGTDDVVTLNDILPGTTLYKSFKVYNTSEDTTLGSTFNIFMTSTPTTSKAQFVHANADTGCYVSSVKPSTDAEPTATCFDGTAYNNVYATLYEVDAAGFAKVQNDGTITDTTGLTNAVMSETRVSAVAGTTATQATQDLVNNITIAGQETKYYVLKVEYKNNNSNQNIENDAALTLKVSIK